MVNPRAVAQSSNLQSYQDILNIYNGAQENGHRLQVNRSGQVKEVASWLGRAVIKLSELGKSTIEKARIIERENLLALRKLDEALRREQGSLPQTQTSRSLLQRKIVWDHQGSKLPHAENGVHLDTLLDVLPGALKNPNSAVSMGTIAAVFSYSWRARGAGAEEFERLRDLALGHVENAPAGAAKYALQQLERLQSSLQHVKDLVANSRLTKGVAPKYYQGLRESSANSITIGGALEYVCANLNQAKVPFEVLKQYRDEITRVGPQVEQLLNLDLSGVRSFSLKDALQLHGGPFPTVDAELRRVFEATSVYARGTAITRIDSKISAFRDNAADPDLSVEEAQKWGDAANALSKVRKALGSYFEGLTPFEADDQAIEVLISDLNVGGKDLESLLASTISGNSAINRRAELEKLKGSAPTLHHLFNRLHRAQPHAIRGEEIGTRLGFFDRRGQAITNYRNRLLLSGKAASTPHMDSIDLAIKQLARIRASYALLSQPESVVAIERETYQKKAHQLLNGENLDLQFKTDNRSFINEKTQDNLDQLGWGFALGHAYTSLDESPESKGQDGVDNADQFERAQRHLADMVYKNRAAMNRAAESQRA